MVIDIWPGVGYFYAVSLNSGMTSVYLDAATACPLHPVAHQALDAATADGWADPGRLYGRARKARQLLDAARQAVAEVVDVHPEEVSFNANGTQAVHSGVLGALRASRNDLLIHSAVEHSSVLHAAQWHRDHGGNTASIPVDRQGTIDIAKLETASAQSAAALVVVQSANHEVGTVQPIGEVARACGSVPLLVDAAQSVGRMPVPIGWSMLTASARKWGGPSGVGVLVVRNGTRWKPVWPQDPHEFDMPGAMNLPAIVAAAASLRAVNAERISEDQRLRELTAQLRHRIAQLPYVNVVGAVDERLPHIVTFSYPFEDGEPMLMALDEAGFAVSAGSSCTASALRPSHVLEAMKVLSHGNIRVSLHRETTQAHIDQFLATLPGVVARLRAEGDVVGP